MCSNFAHDVRKRRIRAMDGEYAPVADGDCNADKSVQRLNDTFHL